MTEDEAEQKWCPFARVVTGHDDGGIFPPANRAAVSTGGEVSWNSNPEHSRCIASACMAWRTAQVGRVLPGDEYKTYREEGFCGLAGAVQ